MVLFLAIGHAATRVRRFPAQDAVQHPVVPGSAGRPRAAPSAGLSVPVVEARRGFVPKRKSALQFIVLVGPEMLIV